MIVQTPDLLNQPVFRWIIIGLFAFIIAAFLAWHLPALKKMDAEDFMVRGGILLVFITVGGANLATVLKWPNVAIYRQPAFIIAGMMISSGLAILLWKHRRNRENAAVQQQFIYNTSLILPPLNRSIPMVPKDSLVVITKTSELVPDGLSGYAKAWAAFVNLVLLTVVNTVPGITGGWQTGLNLGIALANLVAVYGLPNKVEPVRTLVPQLTPAANLEDPPAAAGPVQPGV